MNFRDGATPISAQAEGIHKRGEITSLFDNCYVSLGRKSKKTPRTSLLARGWFPRSRRWRLRGTGTADVPAPLSVHIPQLSSCSIV